MDKKQFLFYSEDPENNAFVRNLLKSNNLIYTENQLGTLRFLVNYAIVHADLNYLNWAEIPIDVFSTTARHIHEFDEANKLELLNERAINLSIVRTLVGKIESPETSTDNAQSQEL